MNPPKFSVIVPTYHRNDLLAKCLDGLAPTQQTLPIEQYEVIVTDDGARTTAEQMIKQDYPWARWVKGPQMGPASNRNNGASYARAEWLVFTDDDCLPEAQWLSAYNSALKTGVLVYEGKTTCNIGLHSPLYHAPINLKGGNLWSCNMMIAKSIFMDLGGFDPSYPYPHMEDVDLKVRSERQGALCQFVETALVDHPPRKLPGGYHLGAMHESEILFFCRQGKRLSLPGLLRDIVKARLRSIIGRQISTDSLLALVELYLELNYVISMMPRWRRKYKTKTGT